MVLTEFKIQVSAAQVYGFRKKYDIASESSFPLFHTGHIFHDLVCPLAVVLPQIFFNLTKLFSNPVYFSLFFVHFLMVLFTSLYFS